MHLYSFLILLLCYNVSCISKECVTYNFEDNDKANFTNTYGICQGMCSWDVGEYSSTITSPHRDSHVFITPRTTLSCISSFKFSITGSGILELNVFMAPAARSDQITLLVFQSLPGATDATVGNAVLSPNDVNFVPGWQTMRVHIVGHGTHEGYITLLGMASETSVVLVDSFRYVAPTYDIDACIIYPDEVSTTGITTEATATTPSTTEILRTTQNPTTSITTTTEKPSTITIPAISTTEIPTTIPITTTTEKPSTITIPETITTEIPSSVTITTTTTTEKPCTTTVSTISTTEEATTTNVTTPTTSTTVTTSTSTARPRLFVSILLVKIKKFFR